VSALLYFAYGSNMSTRRLAARTPSARRVCTARLDGHRLRFHKKGRDGSAKCDAEQSKDGDGYVYGVVFEIAVAEKGILDEHEGLGRGYGEKLVSVVTGPGHPLAALTYFATHIDSDLRPYHWYKEHVVRGASEHNLPSDYIRAIQAVDSIADSDVQKHQEELSIYC